MNLFKKKVATEPAEPMDLDAVMKKYDRESNVRIWQGKGAVFIRALCAAFSCAALSIAAARAKASLLSTLG